MSKVIITDLDGTIYDHRQRAELLSGGDFDAYHSASVNDPPHPEVVSVLQALTDRFLIIAITGRNERYRLITTNWLFKHEVPVDTLWMRGDDDYRKDYVLKQELLDEALEYHGLKREDVLFSIDDRDQSVEGWRESGIHCWQVRPGGY